MDRRTRRAAYQALQATRLLRAEWKHAGFRWSPTMWRRGFLTESRALYGPEAGPEYVTDASRYLRSCFINEPEFAAILDNKLFFHAEIGGRYPQYVAPLVGVVASGRFAGDDELSLEAHIATHGDVVLKPIAGGGGSGIHVVERVDSADGLAIDGRTATERDLRALVAALSGYLVERRMSQASYAEEIFPYATNTIRVLTMRDDDGPFVATAIHRFGVHASAPVDNWDRGGISCAIDLTTGEIGPGATFVATGPLSWHDVHPETGAKLRGAGVHGWTEVRDCALQLAGIPGLDYVGWDIVMTDAGPKVLEGNNNSGVGLLQVHSGLLRDERVRAFFRSRGVLR